MFSPDGKLIVTASADRTARIWQTASGRLLHTLPGYFNSAAFSPDDKLVATGDDHGGVVIWQTATGRRAW